MLRISWFKLVRRVTGMIIGIIVLLVVDAGIALAGYGPPPPPVPVTGGYYCVVTSQTVGPAGKLIGTLELHGKLAATLRIHRGTFPVVTQITITEPYGQQGNCQGNADIGCIGFSGYRAVGGMGIVVQHDGSAYSRTFGKPIALQLTSSLISRSSLLVVWNGRKFVKAPGAVVRRHSATVGVHASSDYAVLVRDRDSCRPHASTLSL